MLHNPNSSLQRRHRQHRRQYSTPPALNAPKPSLLPSIIARQPGFHQRGKSLDQIIAKSSPSSAQTERTVSTNNGLQQRPEQILRQAQQQEPARPGSNQLNLHFQNFLHHQSSLFLEACTAQDLPSLDQISAAATVDQSGTSDPFTMSNHFDSLSFPVGDLTQTGFDLDSFGLSSGDDAVMASMDLNAGQTSVLSKSNYDRQGGAQKMLKGLQTPSKPDSSNPYLITPDPTPTGREYQLNGLQGNLHPLSPSKAKASSWTVSHGNTPRNSATRASGTMVTAMTPLSPSGQSSFLPSDTLDMAIMPEPSTLGPPPAFNLQIWAQPRPLPGAIPSPSISPFSSSPEFQQMQGLEQNLEPGSASDVPTGDANDPFYDGVLADFDIPLPGAVVPDTAASPDFNMERATTDTGISMEDISAFMQGPDPADGKWLCLFPECEKRFGRKENIKSHVQTHLGDRQYRCSHCNKCFVRQHDLKRHAKIHSGAKPYPCACGNSFARQDALTRHRQRASCVGAFAGIEKKVAKRGRPRKNRPEADERIDKAQRSRKQAIPMTASSSSSGIAASPDTLWSPSADDGIRAGGGSNSFDFLDQPLPAELLAMAPSSWRCSPAPDSGVASATAMVPGPAPSYLTPAESVGGSPDSFVLENSTGEPASQSTDASAAGPVEMEGEGEAAGLSTDASADSAYSWFGLTPPPVGGEESSPSYSPTLPLFESGDEGFGLEAASPTSSPVTESDVGGEDDYGLPGVLAPDEDDEEVPYPSPPGQSCGDEILDHMAELARLVKAEVTAELRARAAGKKPFP